MPPNPHLTKYFQIGHVPIQVNTNDSRLLAMIGEWMEDFEVSSWENVTHPIEFTLFGYEVGQPLPFATPAEAVLTFENNSVKYYTFQDLWIADFQKTGVMTIDRVANRIIAYVFTPYLAASILDFEDLMHPLYELMRQMGLYPHHGATVSLEGNGVLLLGKSGQGKSTLSVDLISHGFQFLSDDRCFVREQENGLEVIGFYEPFKVFASNVTHLPLVSSLEEMTVASKWKEPVDIRKHFPQLATLRSELTAMIFPSWSPHEKSRLDVMTLGQALIELLPLTMVCFDRASSKAHFEFSGRLVNKIAAAKLILGQDRENWHRLVQDFIKTARRQADGLLEETSTPTIHQT